MTRTRQMLDGRSALRVAAAGSLKDPWVRCRAGGRAGGGRVSPPRSSKIWAAPEKLAGRLRPGRPPLPPPSPPEHQPLFAGPAPAPQCGPRRQSASSHVGRPLPVQRARCDKTRCCSRAGSSSAAASGFRGAIRARRALGRHRRAAPGGRADAVGHARAATRPLARPAVAAVGDDLRLGRRASWAPHGGYADGGAALVDHDRTWRSSRFSCAGRSNRHVQYGCNTPSLRDHGCSSRSSGVERHRQRAFKRQR